MLRRTCTPQLCRAALTVAAASGSSDGSSWDCCSNRVTSVPKAANAWANSQPVGPPPMMPSDSGAWVRSNTVSLVRGWASARPGMSSGTVGLDPVASTMRDAVMRLSPTATVSWVTSRPRPSITVAPSPRSTSADSVAATRSTVERTRAMAAGKSSPSRAAASSVLEGTQPVKVQSPPGAESVTRATSAPAQSAARTAPRPAAPPPITIRSWSIMRPRRPAMARPYAQAGRVRSRNLCRFCGYTTRFSAELAVLDWAVCRLTEPAGQLSCGRRRGRRGTLPRGRPRRRARRPPASG